MKYLLLITIGIFTLACQNKMTPATQSTPMTHEMAGIQKAYFAEGCFWCAEAVFESVEGVSEAISGYAGGTSKNPTYRIVGSGRTRYAESVEVIYDPKVVSFETLLKVFFGSHDPTTKDRQGPDAGPQYRSIAFYQNDDEKKAIESYVNQLKAQGVPVVTEIAQLGVFYPAEDYHQNYEKRHPENRYVQSVSIPRLRKFQMKYPELLKKNH